MSRGRTRGFILLMAMSAAPSALLAKPMGPLSTVKAVGEAARNNDCDKVLKIVAEQTSAREFKNWPDEAKSYVYLLSLSCAGKQDHYELAYRYANEATKIPGASHDAWNARLVLASELKRWDDVATTVEQMAQAAPDALNAMPVDRWFYFGRALKVQPEARRRLLKVLSAPGYIPDDPGYSTDAFRKEYAAILMDGGDKAGAAVLVAQIDEPRTLVRMSVDSRLRGFIPADFDTRAAVERHIARMREIAAAHAGALRAQLNVVEDYLLLGKGEEALATLQQVHPESETDTYSDKDIMLNWWWDDMARAYTRLGRYDDAVKAYGKGKSLLESGQPNISQTINLASLQVSFGRPVDALATLEPVGAGKIPASPYGKMQYRLEHGCASFALGKREDASADLSYMREHADDALESLTRMLLCMGDLDGAAASMIKRLQMPDESAQVLLELSEYEPSAPNYPMHPSEKALLALKARPDLQAAAVQAGGTRRFNIPF